MKVARASAPPNTPSLEKNSSAEATNKPVKRPVSTAAKKIRRLIRTDTDQVCHPALGGGGDIGAPRCRYAVFALGVAADPCPGEAELARFLPL